MASSSAATTLQQQLLQPHPSTSCQTDRIPQPREPERIHTHAGYYMNPVSKVGVQSHIPRSQFTMSTTNTATTASTMRNNGRNPATTTTTTTTATTTTQRVGMQPTESYYAHPKTSHLSFYQRPLNSLVNAAADGVPQPPHFPIATSIQPFIPQQNPNDSKGSTISHNPYISKQHQYISLTNQYPRNYQNPSSDNSTTTTTREKAATQSSVEQPCAVAERVRILGSNYDHKEMKITETKYDYAYFENKYQELTCKENSEPNIPSKSPEFMRSANHPNRKANQLEQLYNGIDSTVSVAATSTTSTHSNKFSQNYPFQARNNYNQNVHLLNGDDSKSQSTSRFIQTREQYSTVPAIASADYSDISSDEIAKHFRSRNQLSGITASTETNSNSQNIKPPNNYSFNSSNPLQSKTPFVIDRLCFDSKQLDHNPKWFMHHSSEPVAPTVAAVAAATQSGATKVLQKTTTTSIRVAEPKRSNSILLDPCNNEQSSYFMSSCSYTRGILQHPPSYIPESTSTTSKKTSIARESDFLGFNCNTSRPSSNSRSSHTLKHSRTNENLFEPVVVVAITNNMHSNDSQSIPLHGSNAQRNSAASACSQPQANCLDNKRDARSISNATHNIPTSSSSSTTRDSSICRNIQVIPTNRYRNSKEEIELPPHMSYVRTRQLTQNLLIHRPNSEGDSDTLFVSNNQSCSTRTIASSAAAAAAPISNALYAFNAKPKNSILPDEESLHIRQASQNPTPQTGRQSSINNFQISENKSRTHQFQTNISSNSLMNHYQYPTQTRSERSKSEISIVQSQKFVESSTSNNNIAIQKLQQDQPPYSVSTSSHQKNQSIQQEKSSINSYLPLKSKEHNLNFSFSNLSEPTFTKIESQPRNDRIQNPEDHYDIPTLIDPPKKEQFRTEPTTNINKLFVELNCVENQSKIEELAEQVSFLIQKEDKEFEVNIKEQNVQREYMHHLKRPQSQEQKLRENNTSQKSHGCERLSRNSRYILLDWMLRQSVKFSFMRETIHKAFVYLDRFISAVPKYQQEDLFHIALASIMLAAKHEELCPPSIEKFIKNSCFQGDLAAIKKHERILVEKLRWELNVVTPVYWLSIAQFYWDSSHSLSGNRNHSTQSAAPTASPNSPSSRDNMIGVVFREKNNLESYELFRNSYQLLDAAVMDMKICKNYKSREIALAVMVATLEKKAPLQISNNSNKSSSDERYLTEKLDLTHICTFFHTSETFIRMCIDDLKEIDIAIAYDVKPPVKNIKELNRYPEELAYLQWNSYEDYLSISTYPKSNQTLSALFNNC